MKKRLLLIPLVIFLCCSGEKNNPDMELLREKISLQYISSDFDEQRVLTLVETLKPDGSWPGIDYVDTSRVAFQHTEHLNNMVQMTLAYKKEGAGLKGDKRLRQAIDSSLDFWLKNDFICENWWNNQVGTPSVMITILYIMDEDLGQDVVDKMIKIAVRANLDAPGARPGGDRIKIAGLYAKTMLFKRDKKEFEEILKVIEGEMKFYDRETELANAEKYASKNYFSGGRGLQKDYSFQHRPDRVNNTTTYGLDYLSFYVEFAYLVNDTKYKFSAEQLQLAADYFLDGVCKQMVFGRTVDPGVMNRENTRRRVANTTSSLLPERLLEVSDYRKSEVENVIHARKSEPFTPDSYAKFFWQIEHFVFQRPTFYTSVRMFSTRNRNMEEAHNSEGVINHYRADGANYLSLDGNEYFNIAPVYNFRKIPGATVVQADTMPTEREIQKDGMTDFVGGVTDGKYGAAVFDFKSPHNPLSAKKSWFFFDDLYVCLGASINSTDIFPVTTTLNQCFLQGDVSVNDGKRSYVEKEGERYLNDVKWVYHNNTGYIFPKSQKTGLSNKSEQGNWYRTSKQTTTSKENIEKDIFTLWIDHGIKPANDKYEYFIVPATTRETVEKYASNQPVTIISNTEKLQAVKNENIAYFVLYEPGAFNISESIKMSADIPCMIMVKYRNDIIQSITVSDPTRKHKTLELVINKSIQTTNKNVSIQENDNNNILKIQLPEGDYEGKSEVIEM